MATFLIGTAWLIMTLVFMTISQLNAQSCWWTQYNDTNIYNGNQSAALTLPDCQAACLSSTGCQSVDWSPGNSAPERCFLIGKKTEKFSTKDVIHYDLDCADNCTFSVVIDTNILGGTGNGATTLMGCQYACRLSAACQGIDWVPDDPVGRQCYLLNVQSPRRSAPGVNHYDLQCTIDTSTSSSSTASSAAATSSTQSTSQNISSTTTSQAISNATLTKSTATATTTTATATTSAKEATPATLNDCTLSYEFYPMTSSIGGVLIPEIKDPFSCGAACTIIRRCLGLDYGPNVGCWLHYNDTTFAKKYYQPDVIQLKTKRCPEGDISTCFETRQNNGAINDSCSAVCYPKWSRYEHTAASGGQPVFLYSIKNLISCLEWCLNASNCIGIEFSLLPGSESGVCAMYNSSQRQNFTNVILRPFVTQYRLRDRCERYCEMSWTHYDQTAFHAVGKTVEVANATTAADCEIACRMSKSCAMYQVTKDDRFTCTLADDYYLGSAYTNYSVATHTRTLVCNGTILPPTPNPNLSTSSSQQSTTIQQTTATDFNSTCEWQLFIDTFIYQGKDSAARAIEECKSVCLADRTCRGFDWAYDNRPGEKCFLHWKQDTKYFGSGVDHYDLKCKGWTSK